MPEKPSGPEPPDDDQGAASPKQSRAARQLRLLVLLGVLLVVVAVILVVVAVVGRDDSTVTTQTTQTDDVTLVTSPYDLHELPEGTKPSEVKNATLVSISRPNDTGGTDYYSLSSDTDAAKAIIDAVSKAESVEAAQAEPTETTLTFLFDDRSTLLFEVYLEADIVGRAGEYWLADGDLSALIDAAIAIGLP